MVSEQLRTAQRALSIEDVYVREATARTRPDFDPLATLGSPSGALSVQFRIGPQTDVQVLQHVGADGTQRRVQYIVDTGLRVLKPGIEATKQDPTPDDIFADISAKFVVRYLITADDNPTQEMLKAFADNAVHHMWPYWREFLQATTARLRLPSIILPMRVVQTVQSPAEAPLGEQSTEQR
jgi:hypothetical protein